MPGDEPNGFAGGRGGAFAQFGSERAAERNRKLRAEGVSRPAPASMDADRRGSRVRLPALSLPIFADPQLNAEKLHPETPGVLGIVCWKLDERQREPRHCPHDSELSRALDSLRSQAVLGQ